MTETDNKMQELALKTSVWAKISFWCGLLALSLPILFLFLITPVGMLFALCPLLRKLGDFLEYFIFVVPCLLIALPLMAIISGIVGLIIIRVNKTILKGTKKAVTGIILGIASFLLMLGMMQLTRIRNIAVRQMCRNHLLEIGKAIHQYAADNNKYPTDYKWCDLLIEQCNLKEEIFWCGGTDENRLKYKNSNYALNPNAEPNSPPNLVLVCETKYGWNQTADPNLLTAENHMNKGSNVLFNDGHVEFVKKKKFKNLKWKIDSK